MLRHHEEHESHGQFKGVGTVRPLPHIFQFVNRVKKEKQA